MLLAARAAPQFAKRSLCLFSQSNRVRKLAVHVIVHRHFENFILFVILLNALVIGMTDYSHVGTNPHHSDYGAPVAFHSRSALRARGRRNAAILRPASSAEACATRAIALALAARCHSEAAAAAVDGCFF